MHESGMEHGNNAFAVDAELERAEHRLRHLRSMDNRLVFGAAALSGLSATLAGFAPSATEATLSSVGGWRMVCYGVAAVGYFAALASVLHKTWNVTQQVVEAQQCLGELKALSVMSEFLEPKNAAEQLAQIHKKFPRALG